MKRQTRILQQGVQILAVHRRPHQPQKRIRGKQDKGNKRDPDRALHRQNPRPQAIGQVSAKDRRRSAEKRQDKHPKQHRALVVPPNTADLVKHRLGGVRIRYNQPQREIRGHEGIHQYRKGKPEQQELRDRSRLRQRHPRRLPPVRADHRHDGLHKGHAKRQNQREMSKFHQHGATLASLSAAANGHPVTSRCAQR